MTHIEKARDLLRQADRHAETAAVSGCAIIEALALLASAHIAFAAAFGDSTDD